MRGSEGNLPYLPYRNLVDLDERVGGIAESGMAVKISLERYRMFFVPGTLAQEQQSRCYRNAKISYLSSPRD